MTDTRDLDETAFAQHMRQRRGLPDRAYVECGTRFFDDNDGADGAWEAWIIVADTHPWYGESTSEIEAIDTLLRFGETSWVDECSKGWQINLRFCESHDRAKELLRYVITAANAALRPRSQGMVTSSR